MKEVKPSVSRRRFIKISLLSGSGLALGYIGLSGESPEIVQFSGDQYANTEELNAYIFINESGKVIIYNHRPEMGQGTFQAIPMIIAEELEVDINDVIIKASPANRSKYGDQMVVGSRSINNNFELMRKVGASAKALFLAAAAKKWSIAEERCYAEKGKVINKDNKQSFSYAELIGLAKTLPVPQSPKLKEPKDFRLIGKSISRQDIPSKVNGAAVYGMDVKLPGMLVAVISHSPVFEGTVKSYDAEKTLKVPGVRKVIRTRRETFGKVREGLAVLADHYWAALKGMEKLEVAWENKGLEQWNSGRILEYFQKGKEEPAEIFRTKGDFKKTFDAAEKKIGAEYFTPYQAHTPMESMNATVWVKKDACEFWGPTQNPNGVKSFLARLTGIPEEKVTINYTQMGGAFGRRSLTDLAEEAARLSMESGSPVQVVWTKEDDITQGPFRACSLNVLKGSVKDGKVTALEHRVICQDIRAQGDSDTKASSAVAGGINTEYEIADYTVGGVLRKLHIPVSYWRSVYHSTNCFAHESFIDELAHAAGKDPLYFRLDMLKGHRRYTAVLRKVAEMSNWFSKSPEHSAKGVAIVERSGAFVAMVAEVTREDNHIKPVKIYAAIDAGLAVNPDIIRSQTEGCIIMGLQAAWYGLTVENGKIVENNYHSYRMPRIGDCPELMVHVMENAEQPEGAGEAGLPPVAPALVNAIFALTQKRIRSLPLGPVIAV